MMDNGECGKFMWVMGTLVDVGGGGGSTAAVVGTAVVAAGSAGWDCGVDGAGWNGGAESISEMTGPEAGNVGRPQ